MVLQKIYPKLRQRQLRKENSKREITTMSQSVRVVEHKPPHISFALYFRFPSARSLVLVRCPVFQEELVRLSAICKTVYYWCSGPLRWNNEHVIIYILSTLTSSRRRDSPVVTSRQQIADWRTSASGRFGDRQHTALYYLLYMRVMCPTLSTDFIFLCFWHVHSSSLFLPRLSLSLPLSTSLSKLLCWLIDLQSLTFLYAYLCVCLCDVKVYHN